MGRIFDTPLNTNDQSIERVLAAGLPVALVIVGKAVSPDLEQTMNRLASEYAGQLLVVKMNKEENPATVGRFGVNLAPSVVTVDKGQTVSQAEAISSSDLAQHIAYLLGKGPKPVDRKQTQSTSTTGISGVSGTPVDATAATFDSQVLQASQPVLVDFWAPWCGPCRTIEPTVKKLASEYAGRLRVVKINVDENPSLSGQYGVQGIPTMMIFRDGQIADRWSGALPEPALRSRVQTDYWCLMCELFGMSSSIPATVNLSLEEFAKHGGLTGIHKDGWGIAFYEDHDVQLLREASAASESPLVSFVREHGLTSGLVISHIRRATQGANALRNTQPFARALGGRMHVFAHNGDLKGLPHDSPLTQGRFSPIGETDSEYAFCHPTRADDRHLGE